MKRRIEFKFILFTLALFAIFGLRSSAQNMEKNGVSIAEIEKKVTELMKKGEIPGLSLVIIRGDQPVYVKGFGYADLETKSPVTDKTLFEIGSTSKAFTGLGILQCEAEGLVKLDDPVSKYLPGFHGAIKGNKVEITIRQFLHQTTGIPNYKALAMIPPSNEKDALQNAAKAISGIELDFFPGSRFEYSTTNYDILGAVIEKASGMSFEEYITKKVLLPLGMNDSVVGRVGNPETAVGYKTSFFKPRRYDAPIYRGNTPAGYIIMDGVDLAIWLKAQLGMIESPLKPLIETSHQNDLHFPMQMGGANAYGMGWFVMLDGSGEIWHGGNNPNYTSHFVFNPDKKTAVAVLTNSSNLTYVPYIGNAVMCMISGVPLPPDTQLDGGFDKGSSMFMIIEFVILFIVFIFILSVFFQVIKGSRKFEVLTIKKFGKIILTLVIMAPFCYGLYLLPMALGEVSWSLATVWMPGSFTTALWLVVGIMGAGFIAYILSSIFPHRNKYFKQAPSLAVISLLSGIANAGVIFLITMSLMIKPGQRVYLVFYFVLTMLLYLVGRKELQVKLVNISFDIIYDLRITLIEKIFKTSYQRFEKLDTGRVIATLNNDTAQLGGLANILVAIMTSLITIFGAFAYLASIAFWATVVTLVVIAIVATIYFLVGQKANVLFNEARNTQNVYLQLLNGLNTGFKELSLHFTKKHAYKTEVENITASFRNASTNAMVKFVNAFMVGESMLIVVLAAVGFGLPVYMPEISRNILMSFIMVLLYLIGPVNGVLNSIPGLMQLRIAWQRIQGLIKDIPANITTEERPALIKPTDVDIETIKATGVFFEYESKEAAEKFCVGPIDFEAKKGEVIFIIGGNGSGKTTLAKLLTGLYIPEKGSITLNDKPIDNEQLGEFYSVVFGDYHLFEKLYDVDLTGKEEEVMEYLKMLRLEEKVKLENNAFSTVDLSGGQRKRLALLRCYLEDRPIYLFDEVAADQDPEFRKFFYRTLLTRMKEKGKMVIAITHDDHYFDVADKVIKMDMGKIELIDDREHFSVTK